MNANPHFPACLRLWDIIALLSPFNALPALSRSYTRPASRPAPDNVPRKAEPGASPGMPDQAQPLVPVRLPDRFEVSHVLCQPEAPLANGGSAQSTLIIADHSMFGARDPATPAR